jgi:hypothetical protein
MTSEPVTWDDINDWRQRGTALRSEYQASLEAAERDLAAAEERVQEIRTAIVALDRVLNPPEKCGRFVCPDALDDSTSASTTVLKILDANPGARMQSWSIRAIAKKVHPRGATIDLHSAIYKLVKTGVIDFTGTKWRRLYARKSSALPKHAREGADRMMPIASKSALERSADDRPHPDMDAKLSLDPV